MSEAKNPATAIHEHELALARQRVEQQQRTIAAFGRSLVRNAPRPRNAAIGPDPMEAKRPAGGTPPAAPAALAIGWPSIPMPKTALPPPAGLAAHSLTGRKFKIAAVAVFGLEAEALEQAVEGVAGRQRQAMDFVPVFLTDSANHRAFHRHGYAFEYFPQSAYGANVDATAFQDKLFSLWKKWRIGSLIDLGERLFLENRLVSCGGIEAFVSSPNAALSLQTKPIRFSVISAVYNTAKYLDDYFRSITTQSLSFKSQIELILVDDGSTDRSAKIIAEWCKKFPANIHYFRKENGGPASARNFGLTQASHDWVTFIDSDDFVDKEYFAEVERTIRKYGEKHIAMVSCNYIIHAESTATKSDTHPLRFRFSTSEIPIPVTGLDRLIQGTVNSAFFRHREIRLANLKFEPKSRPGFEDGHFVGRYLHALNRGSVIFLGQAKYFYRKRMDGSSLVDSAKADPEWYGDQLRYGCLGLLRATSDARGKVSAHIQNLVLYELTWRFRYLVDNPEAIAFLGAARQRRFRRLLSQIFSLIEIRSIVEYDVTDQPFFYRVGLLNLFKDSDPQYQAIDVTDIDERKKLIRLVYWSRHADPPATFLLDRAQVSPAYAKRRRRNFLESTFCWEHISWLPISNAALLTVKIGKLPTFIHIKGRQFAQRVHIDAIRSAFAAPALDEARLPAEVRQLRALARSPEVTANFRDAWVFMDMDTDGDDSAEHLYRYVRKHNPRISTYFVLRREAPDWKRLEEDGFRLLRFNTPEHASALLHAKFLISSHANGYVHDRLPSKYFKDMLSFRFVFLQHGIIKDNISGWLNGKRIDCFVTSTRAEYRFVAGDSSFDFSRKEVVLTGMPRHDALLGSPTSDARTIVIMPTWRESLVGSVVGLGNARRFNPEFGQSEYARRWKSILTSPRLLGSADRSGHKLVFVPHKNIEPYLSTFDLPSSVQVRCFGDGEPISPLFQQLSLFITDFSSKAFDIAYIGKPLIYYQFDREVFLGGGHTSRPGYFNYKRDGFGPALEDEDKLLDAIEAFLDGTPPDPIYRKRARKTFVFRDGKCCERVYKAILALDEPYV